MDILIGILTAVEVIVCLLLILVVLMQRPRQEGLGASFGDAAASQVWGAQTTNVLQKFTVWLAIILFGLTLLLAVLISRTQTGGKSQKIFGDAKPAPAAPAADPHAAIPAKATEPAKTEAPKAADKKAEPAKTAEPAKSEPAIAPAPEAPKAAAPAPTPAAAPASAPATTSAPTPAPAAPATQPK